MDIVEVAKFELEWLMNCSEIEMGDGDTARTLAEKWLKGESAIDDIRKLYLEYNIKGE